MRFVQLLKKQGFPLQINRSPRISVSFRTEILRDISSVRLAKCPTENLLTNAENALANTKVSAAIPSAREKVSDFLFLRLDPSLPVQLVQVEGKAHGFRAGTELRAALDPYAVALSVEVSAGLMETGRDDAAGLTLAGLAGVADRIYAPAAPEQTEDFSAAAKAAGADFVPMRAAETPLPETGSRLLIP